MNIGASSSCFYPLETEKSLELVGKVGIKITEVFFNSPSELDYSFLKQLEKIKAEHSMKITAVHPFMSFSEGYSLFSPYLRRFTDGLELFKKYFEAAATLGAGVLNLHGGNGGRTIPDSEYAERLGALIELGKTFGVCVSHENVVHYFGETPQFMEYLHSQLGEDFKMTLDLKQARRANIDPFEFVRLLGPSICHIHVSDCSKTEDCLTPQEDGLFDFARLFSAMDALGFGGSYIVELYRRNFKDENELRCGVEYLKTFE